MKIIDAVRLGQANIRGHKGRTLLVVVTVSVLFGALMGVIFVLQGLEESVLGYAGEKTEGEVYIVADESAARKAGQYGGEEAGKITEYEIATFGQGKVLDTIDREAVEEVFDGDFGVFGEKLPIIATDKMKEILEMKEAAEERGEEIGYGNYLLPEAGEYEIIGIMPEGRGSLYMGAKKGLNLNPLNIVLDGIGFEESYQMLIVDEGDGKIFEYIERVREKMEVSDEFNEDWIEDEEGETGGLETTEYAVLRFGKISEAYNYMQEVNDWQMKPRAREIFGGQTEVFRAGRNTEKMFGFALVGLTIVAVVIMAFTFAHLISMEAQTVALYRSMGATLVDIIVIYLIYLVEICILAVVVATVMGIFIAGAMTLVNAEELKMRLEDFYQVEKAGEIVLVGWNAWYFRIVLVMMAVAPVAFLLTVDQLSTKNIAKRLKED